MIVTPVVYPIPCSKMPILWASYVAWGS